MRIYQSEDGKQLLADFRPVGGRDVALGTLNWERAATIAAEKYAKVLIDRPAPGTAGNPQLELVRVAGARVYMLSEALSYLVRKGCKRDGTRSMHEANSRYILSVIGDRDVNATDWYDVWLDAREKWLEDELANVTINKRQATLSRALTLANRPLGRGEQYMARPAHLPDYLDNDTIARTRWFTPEEMAAFVDTIMTYCGPAHVTFKVRARMAKQYTPEMRRGRAVRFLIRCWTGLRNGDARRLRVRDFNLVTGHWFRLSSKKAHPPVWLEMVDPLRRLVEEWLTTRRDLQPNDPVLYPWPDEWRGLNILASYLRVEPCTPHDYRRTAAHLIRMCSFDREYCRRWLGLDSRSRMLEEVYLQDDPLARADPERVRELEARISGGRRRRALTPIETVDVEFSTSNQPPNRIHENQTGEIMDKTDDELATRRNLRERPENYGDAEARKADENVPRDRVELSTHGFSVQRGIGEITREKGEITPETSNQPPKSPGKSASGVGGGLEVAAYWWLFCDRCMDKQRCADNGGCVDAGEGDTPAPVAHSSTALARAIIAAAFETLCRCGHRNGVHVGTDGRGPCEHTTGDKLDPFCHCEAFELTGVAPFSAGPGVCGDRTDSGRFYCSLPTHGNDVRHFYGGVTSEAGVDDRPSVLEAPEGPTLVTLCATCNLGLNANPSHYNVGPAGHEFVNGGAK